jgi:hypothetical protein
MPDGFKSVHDIMNDDPGLAPVRKIIKQSEVVLKFGDIFPDLGKLVKAVKVEKKILFLNVDNSVLRSELRFQDILIAKKINEYFSEERIKGIRFI